MKPKRFKPKLTKNTPPDDYDKNLSHILLLILAIYGTSLLLPAFGWSGANGANGGTGFAVLILGLLMGWLAVLAGVVGAIAVYANLFFFSIIARLFVKPKASPIIAVILMSVLAMMSFSFREPPSDSSTSIGDKVDLWGYGAYCWFFALFSLTYVVLARVDNPQKMFKVTYFLATFFVIMGLLVGIQNLKYNKASELEKEKYFYNWVILTNGRITGIEYNPPQNTGIVLTKDSVVYSNTRFAVDYVTQNDEYYLKRYQQGCDRKTVGLLPMRKIDYYYDTWKDGSSEYFELRDQNKNVVWSVKSTEVNGAMFPDYRSDIREFFKPLERIKPIIDDDVLTKLENETFTKSDQCSISISNKDEYSKIIHLYGKSFLIREKYTNPEDDYRIYCGKDYDFVVQYLSTEDRFNPGIGIVFDKNSQEPIMEFDWLDERDVSKDEKIIEQGEVYQKIFTKQDFDNIEQFQINGYIDWFKTYYIIPKPDDYTSNQEKYSLAMVATTTDGKHMAMGDQCWSERR